VAVASVGCLFAVLWTMLLMQKLFYMR
jgi:hypothetical protein